MLRKLPLIVLIGSTGTGKTKLSIELARRFDGEIISADSMQVYKGLSIASAKATNEEQQLAPHHLLDIVAPHESFTVTHFRDKALPIINNLLQTSKIPIIVGGTNYWIEALLWKNLVSPGVGFKRKNDNPFERELEGFSKEIRNFYNDAAFPDSMLQMESAQLFEHLKIIDPPTANKLHPNNKRKIMRALEVFKDYGKRMSELIEDQRKVSGASNLGGPKRFEHVVIFWLQCEQEILNERLNSRVDGMVKNGLLAEIRAFYKDYIQNRSSVDYEEGILQTIGFKEFIPYLEKYDSHQDALINEFVEASNTLDEPEGYKLLLQCLEELKSVTQRYSKRQLKWIRNRFLGSDSREIPLVYPLDTSNVSEWMQKVYTPAEETIASYINEDEIKLVPLSRFERKGKGFNGETSNYCEICQRTFVGEFQWVDHMKSNKHKKMKQKRQREERKTKTDEACQ